MEPHSSRAGEVFERSKRFARRLLTIGENRFELMMVEVQEERERLLHAILLALGVAAFGLLSGVAFTGVIVILLWDVSRIAALVVLATLYGGAAVCLYRRLAALLRDWENFPATLDQLRKDRACFEKNLS